MRDGRVLLLGLTLAGCAAQIEAPTVTAVPGREDLSVLSLRAHVAAGLSDPVTVDVPDGVDAALIEVAGERGQFRLAQLSTPSGRDAVESGGFVTRDAREVDGLVDWLYPNSTAQTLEAGRYVLRFTALGAGGSVVDEDVTVRLYTRAQRGRGRRHQGRRALRRRRARAGAQRRRRRGAGGAGGDAVCAGRDERGRLHGGDAAHRPVAAGARRRALVGGVAGDAAVGDARRGRARRRGAPGGRARAR